MIKVNINGNLLERGNCYLAFVTYLDSLKGCIFTLSLPAYLCSLLGIQLVGTFTIANLYDWHEKKDGNVSGFKSFNNHNNTDTVLEQIKREKCIGLEPILIYGGFIFLIHMISFKHLCRFQLLVKFGSSSWARQWLCTSFKGAVSGCLQKQGRLQLTNDWSMWPTSQGKADWKENFLNGNQSVKGWQNCNFATVLPDEWESNF